MRLRLPVARLSLLQSCAGLIAFAQGYRAFVDQLGDAVHVGLSLLQPGACSSDGGILQFELSLCRAQASRAVGQRRLLCCRIGRTLLQLLLIGRIVDPGEQFALLHALEVRHRHFDEVACNLRTDDRGAAADIGVVRRFIAACEWRQAPGEQRYEHAEEDCPDRHHDPAA